MKIASWNVNSLRVRLPQVIAWLTQHQPDILAVQEIKVSDAEFPYAAFKEIGYHAISNGQKTYNGVAFISKLPAEHWVTDPPGLIDTQRRILAASFDGVRVINLYVPNGSAVGSDKYAYKLDWLIKIREFIRDELARYPRLVVLGDFNIAPEDRDVYDPEAWREHILCSTPEREAFRALQALGLSDAFRQFEQPEACFSWWDYRSGSFRRNLGLRIDHILVSNALLAVCKSCRIDKLPRALERPSDHAPVLAAF
jgi:exodeoxyribonuclease-3